MVRLGHQELHVAVDHLVRAIAENALGGGVEGLDGAALVDGDDAVNDTFQDGSVEGLALPQRFLGAHSFGDVEFESANRGGRAVGAGDGKLGGPNKHLGPIWPKIERFVLARAYLAGLHHLLIVSFILVRHVRGIEIVGRLAQQLIRG